MRVRPTSLSTGTFPLRGVVVLSSRTTASSSAPSVHASSATLLVLEKSPPAPTTQALTVVRSVTTTKPPEKWQWSSTSAKTIGIRNYLTWNSPTTIRSAPPLVWPPTRFTWAGYRASLLLFRPLRGRRPSETSPRPPFILQPGIETPTVRQRCCPQNPCLDTFSSETADSDALRQVPNFIL